LFLFKKINSKKNIYKIALYVSSLLFFSTFWSKSVKLAAPTRPNLKYAIILLFYVSLDASPFTEKFDRGVRIRQGAEVDGF
jgi:hypothetical protein